MEPLVERALLNFYGWWQFAVCLFAFVGLMGIWYHIGRRQGDLGQVWLAVSVLCWSISGLVEVIYSGGLDPSGLYDNPVLLPDGAEFMQPAQNSGLSLDTSVGLAGWRSILSLLNSLFILLALPWFRYVPTPIEPLVKSRFWYLIVGIPFLFSLLPTLSRLWSNQPGGFINELDVYYALFTVIFLGYVLWSSFARRRLPLLAGLAVVCILITIVAQLYKFGNNDLDLTLLSAIFKTSLIMMFFALALSWVKELSEAPQFDRQGLRIALRTEKDEKGKMQRMVRLDGIVGKDISDIPLSPALFELLQTFLDRRRQHPEAGWLEIKPKREVRSGKQYDIQDHNQLKRLIEALLDGLYGKDNWSRPVHREPLKELLFEQSTDKERLVRIKVY